VENVLKDLTSDPNVLAIYQAGSLSNQGGKEVDKEKLEVIKVGSLAVIAVSLAIIAWKMRKIVNYLYDLVQLSVN